MLFALDDAPTRPSWTVRAFARTRPRTAAYAHLDMNLGSADWIRISSVRDADGGELQWRHLPFKFAKWKSEEHVRETGQILQRWSAEQVVINLDAVHYPADVNSVAVRIARMTAWIGDVNCLLKGIDAVCTHQGACGTFVTTA